MAIAKTKSTHNVYQNQTCICYKSYSLLPPFFGMVTFGIYAPLLKSVWAVEERLMHKCQYLWMGILIEISQQHYIFVQSQCTIIN